MKKIISLTMCIIMLLGVFTTIASAEEDYGVAPCFNNTSNTMTSFIIEDDGEACVYISYAGYIGVCTGATITSKIQKKFLLFFWKDVENGMPDNEWVDVTTEHSYVGVHSIYVTEKGTYRAVVEYVIRGTGGSDDVVEEKMEYKYE